MSQSMGSFGGEFGLNRLHSFGCCGSSTTMALGFGASAYPDEAPVPSF
jgi:hypothetical protein